MPRPVGIKYINVRVPVAIYDRLKELAGQDDRSLNSQVLHVLRQYATKNELANQAK